jgi:hypothetical protein
MFPGFRQRLLILAGIAAAGWAFVQVVPLARAADGTPGLTLLLAGSPWQAIAAFAAIMAGAALLGALIGAWGNPLAGIFTLAAALGCAAAAGGEIEPWLRRADSPRIYLVWSVEAALWGVLIWALGSLCLELAARWRNRWTAPPPGDEPRPASSGQGEPAQTRGSRDPLRQLVEDMRRLPPRLQTIGALAVAIVVGSVAVAILVPVSDTWQVIWGVLIAFMLASLAADQMFPAAHPMALLLSPLATAAAWYALTGLVGADADAMLRAHFAGELKHAALALPVHYASAGVAGIAAGIGWSRYLRPAA